MRTARAGLRAHGRMCRRITRAEVMTSTGAQFLRSLLSGGHSLLRVATPADWHVRLPVERAGPHY
eukprot:1081590-Pyramimonas_sp.AAC.1